MSRRSDATRQCRLDAQAAGEDSINAAVAMMAANADQYGQLRTMYERLCQGADAAAIEGYLTQHQSVLLTARTPAARINDIASTCMTFRERYDEVRRRPGAPGATPTGTSPEAGRR